MSKKKTLNVESFKSYVNKQLARTDGFANESFKCGLATTLEHVLHATGNYNGYTQLYWDEIGWIDWRKDGETEVWEEKKKYIYGDVDSKYKGNQYARRYY
jgi:hypothetical protein